MRGAIRGSSVESETFIDWFMVQVLFLKTMTDGNDSDSDPVVQMTWLIHDLETVRRVLRTQGREQMGDLWGGFFTLPLSSPLTVAC